MLAKKLAAAITRRLGEHTATIVDFHIVANKCVVTSLAPFCHLPGPEQHRGADALSLLANARTQPPVALSRPLFSPRTSVTTPTR
eukprot:5943902-Pleurochrysis_carterae.AAC.2